MVTVPKPPGSRQLILPLVAVLGMAPVKVLQGAVRLHGLASSPTPKPRFGSLGHDLERNTAGGQRHPENSSKFVHPSVSLALSR